jgi:mono/diheme cytochrome c family protein
VRPATAAALVLVAAAAALAVLGLADADGGSSAPSSTPDRSSSAPATPARHDGEAVWVAQGCGSCHTLAAAGSTGVVGPDLDQTLRGMPAADIRTSIVDPSAVAAAGYGTGTMPEDYASRMSEAELDRLVAFLRRPER